MDDFSLHLPYNSGNSMRLGTGMLVWDTLQHLAERRSVRLPAFWIVNSQMDFNLELCPYKSVFLLMYFVRDIYKIAYLLFFQLVYNSFIIRL